MGLGTAWEEVLSPRVLRLAPRKGPHIEFNAGVGWGCESWGLRTHTRLAPNGECLERGTGVGPEARGGIRAYV